jgi:shikimate dehydrogenase
MDSREIDGATGLTAIFGDPVEHSRSPAMHNAAYAKLRMNRKYVAFHVKPKDLVGALRALGALDIIGANLTVPHKERAARIVKGLSAEARTLGSVNCVVNRHGELFGDNTDARGLELDLRELGAVVRGGLAVIIGAGGAAASSVLACQRLGARRIVIANRTPRRALALARRLKNSRFEAALEPCGLDALIDANLIAEARIIINATPMGLTTRTFAALNYPAAPADCLFYDLIYSAGPTAFLKPAIALGHPTADGAGMLVKQGELAFKLFNRIAPPKGVMLAALNLTLGRPVE